MCVLFFLRECFHVRGRLCVHLLACVYVLGGGTAGHMWCASVYMKLYVYITAS